MPEAYSWIEGQMWLSTGVPFVTSALIALAEQSNATMQFGWVNQVAASGNYTDFTTGQRGNVSWGVVHTFDKTLIKLAEAKTAVHLKMHHNTINGSAGVYLWSGRIDSYSIVGQNAGVYRLTMQAHFNSWSAY